MTGFNAGAERSQDEFTLVVTGERDQEILALWSAGRDTLDIARHLGVPECSIANRVPRILQQVRGDAEWNSYLLTSAEAA